MDCSVCTHEDFKLVTDYSIKAPELEALAQMHTSYTHVPGRREHGRNHLRAAAQECEARPAHPHPGPDGSGASLGGYLLCVSCQDGTVMLEVTEAKDDEVLCKASRIERGHVGREGFLGMFQLAVDREVVNNCKLGEKKNVNVPGRQASRLWCFARPLWCGRREGGHPRRGKA